MKEMLWEQILWETTDIGEVRIEFDRNKGLSEIRSFKFQIIIYLGALIIVLRLSPHLKRDSGQAGMTGKWGVCEKLMSKPPKTRHSGPSFKFWRNPS